MVDLSIVFCMFTRSGINGSEFWRNFQPRSDGVSSTVEVWCPLQRRGRSHGCKSTTTTRGWRLEKCETRMRMFDERKPQNLQIFQGFYLFGGCYNCDIMGIEWRYSEIYQQHCCAAKMFSDFSRNRAGENWANGDNLWISGNEFEAKNI